jgi:adenylate kinase
MTSWSISGKMHLVIFGPPGVGKGTQSIRLAGRYSIPHISTGDIFRSEIKGGNSELKQYVEKGLLVPADVVNKIVEKALKREECKAGFILDGYPRSIEQAEYLENVLWKLNRKIDVVLNMAAPEEDIIKRLSMRVICSKCGAHYNLVTMKPKHKNKCDKCEGELISRKDDEAETVKKRIKVYIQETQPLIDYYRKKELLVDIDATPKPAEVFNSLTTVADRFKEK